MYWSITAEKQKIKLLKEGIFTLEIAKELCRDHWTINKAIEKTKLRTQSKEKGFKDLLPWDECKVN